MDPSVTSIGTFRDILEALKEAGIVPHVELHIAISTPLEHPMYPGTPETGLVESGEDFAVFDGLTAQPITEREEDADGND